MGRTQKATGCADAPTVAIHQSSGYAPVAPPSRRPGSPLAVIGLVAAGIAVLLTVGVIVDGRSAASVAAPVPAVAPAAPAPLSSGDRIDATLKGLQAGLNYRASWGNDLTRENITQPCEVQASVAYPSSPAAAQVFATGCVNNALG
jgi:hypothetical protein